MSAVASPGRAVRPYKTRYYCNTGRLIESFPRRRFLRRRCIICVCARQLQKVATPRTCPERIIPLFSPFFPFPYFFPPSVARLSRVRFSPASAATSPDPRFSTPPIATRDYTECRGVGGRGVVARHTICPPDDFWVKYRTNRPLRFRSRAIHLRGLRCIRVSFSTRATCTFSRPANDSAFGKLDALLPTLFQRGGSERGNRCQTETRR